MIIQNDSHNFLKSLIILNRHQVNSLIDVKLLVVITGNLISYRLVFWKLYGVY